MKIKRAFIDMDGVVADFVTAIHRAHNRENVYTNPENFNHFDLENIWRISKAEFWKTDTHEFWESVPKTPEADELVAIVTSKFGPENVAFLTSPSNSGGCYTGKRAWLQRHFPELKDQVVFAKAASKRLMATGDALLIDDRNENVSEFSEAGGNAILFPRPWNIGFGIKPGLEFVLKNLEHYER